MKTLPIITSVLVCICLDSCVSWEIGGCIRHAGDRYQGVDLGFPGLTIPDTAPEVTYRLNRPLVKSAGFIGGALHSPKAEDVQPTGRTVQVPPQDPRGNEVDVVSDDMHRIRRTETLESPSVFRHALAVPFDIVIDPVLDIVTSPFVYFFQ